MEFKSPLIVVADMARSMAFYKRVFGLDVAVDFGANVTLTGGLALQTLDTWRAFIGGLDVTFKGNDAELYFEDDDFDGFVRKLIAFGDIDYVHPPLEHSWGQRAVRIYDPDGHVIEVGERMGAVAVRFQNKGMNIAEIAARMGVEEKYIRGWL